MGMIQTELKDDRGEIITLNHDDPRYWEGPYRYVAYPKAVYRITQPGQQEAEHRIVKSEREQSELGSAWKESPADAKAHFEALEAEVAKAAAESAYQDRNLSELAKAERLAHERSTDEMVVSVPEKPRRGRKPKAVVSTE